MYLIAALRVRFLFRKFKCKHSMIKLKLGVVARVCNPRTRRQKNHELQARFGYMVRAYLKKQNKNKAKKKKLK
jgi:hypothetical protein